ncbi:MAG: MFS transporter [Chloroflexota bacterium]
MSASPDGALATYARILRSATYRPLWLGQVVSNFGDTLHYVALVVLLFRLTGSGAVLAALALAQIVAGLVLGPFAGVLVDRLDRRTALVAADLARAALATMLAFTANAPLAFGLAVALTAAGVPFRPALQSLLPSLVDEDDLLAANSVGWSTEQGTQIVAAALAGALLLAWGARPVFLVNAASFAFSAFMLCRLPRQGRLEQAVAPAPAGAFWQDAREGLLYAVRDAFVGPLLLIQGLAALATGGTSALLVVLASRHLQLPPAGFSWLLLTSGAGALVGPFLLPRRLGADPRLIFWPYVWRGLGDILLALLTPFPIALFLFFPYGLGTATGAVTYNTVVQRRVPDRVRGRVFATLDVVWATGEIASIGLAGLLVDHFGIVAVYLGGGVLLMLAGALGLLLPGTGRSQPRLAFASVNGSLNEADPSPE